MMKLNVKPGDRVVRISQAEDPFRADVQHGNVAEITDEHIVCYILADVWTRMTFDHYGRDPLGYSLIRVADLAWLFSGTTVWYGGKP